MIQSIGQISQKSLFRLASILYPSINNKTPNTNIISTMIQSVLAERGNQEMGITDIVACILEDFKATVTHKEVINAVKSEDMYFVVALDAENEEYISTVNLSEIRFNEIRNQLQNEIGSLFEKFATEQNLNLALCRESLSKYFFELTTTNLNTFNQIFDPTGNAIEDSFSELDLTVDINDLSDEEKEILQAFFAWENAEKRDAIISLILCVLEFCLFTSTNQSDRFHVDVKYQLYLDTNIIFRALGINGNSRKLIILDFLKKAKEANIDIIISSFTSAEFFNTIDYYISQIVHTSRGGVYSGAYSDLSDYSIFDFYNEWRQEHKESNMRYFKAFVNSQFMLLLKSYDINSASFSQLNPFLDKEKSLISKYQAGINKVKREFKEGASYYNEYEDLTPKYNHDALLIRGIESEYLNDSSVVRFIISTDKSLRYWDFKRQRVTAPFVLYPSHFLPFLMRICGRTDESVDCFMKLIAVRANKPKLSISQANIIVAAISSITEDINNQKLLVSCVLEEELQSEIRNCKDDAVLYEKIQEFSKNYLEKENQELEEIAKRESERAAGFSEQLEQERNVYRSKISTLTGDANSVQNQIRKQAHTIDKMVEDRVRGRFFWFAIISPILAITFILFCCYFFTIQLFFQTSSLNVLPSLLAWCYSTLLGKDTGQGLLIFINGVIITLLGFISVKWCPRIPRLFSPTKRKVLLEEMKQGEVNAISSLKE